ncbi:MAG: hypothetical protein WD059_09780 [Balneolaceae bacterium]
MSRAYNLPTVFFTFAVLFRQIISSNGVIGLSDLLRRYLVQPSLAPSFSYGILYSVEDGLISYYLNFKTTNSA